MEQVVADMEKEEDFQDQIQDLEEEILGMVKEVSEKEEVLVLGVVFPEEEMTGEVFLEDLEEEGINYVY